QRLVAVAQILDVGDVEIDGAGFQYVGHGAFPCVVWRERSADCAAVVARMSGAKSGDVARSSPHFPASRGHAGYILSSPPREHRLLEVGDAGGAPGED